MRIIAFNVIRVVSSSAFVVILVVGFIGAGFATNNCVVMTCLASTCLVSMIVRGFWFACYYFVTRDGHREGAGEKT